MNPIKVYAGYNIDISIRMCSSSGAVFTLLAEQTLLEQGVVYGVKMSEDCYSAEFTRVTDKEDLIWLQGSKYLQAKVGNTYKQVKKDLISGKTVLFSGTSCQINGLKYFLGKDYENLLCVDVICHGAPSPALWREYAMYQEKKNGGKLKSINFRCKDNSWIDFGMRKVIKKIPQGEYKKLCISKDKDSYMLMFLRDYCLRPSCYECVAKTAKMSDLTIADFWGINQVASEMNDGNGTSLILLRTEKGCKAFESVSKNMQVKEVSYADGVRENPAEYRSCIRPSQRDTFFNDMNSMPFEEMEKKYVTPIRATETSGIKTKIKIILRNILSIIGVGRSRARKNGDMDYFLCFVFDNKEKTK